MTALAWLRANPPQPGGIRIDIVNGQPRRYALDLRTRGTGYTFGAGETRRGYGLGLR